MRRVWPVAFMVLLAGSTGAEWPLLALHQPQARNFEGWNGNSAPAHFTLSPAYNYPWGGYYDLDEGYKHFNRAYAFRQDAAGPVLGWGVRPAASSPIAWFALHLVNETGGPITKLEVAWTAAQYTEAGRATEMDLRSFSIDGGATWPTGGVTSDTFTASTTSGDPANLWPIVTAGQTATITFSTPIDDGASFAIRWRIAPGDGSGSNAHLGFTDFTLTPRNEVTTPTRPTGPDFGCIEQALSFTTGGAVCNKGHVVEYQFDWGDKTLSDWGAWTRSTSYGAPGIYEVRVRARCEFDETVVSGWSSPHAVAIESRPLEIVSIAIAPVPDGFLVTVAFFSREGCTYELQGCPDLAYPGGARWRTIETVEGTGGLVHVEHRADGLAPAFFYRVAKVADP